MFSVCVCVCVCANSYLTITIGQVVRVQGWGAPHIFKLEILVANVSTISLKTQMMDLRILTKRGCIGLPDWEGGGGGGEQPKASTPAATTVNHHITGSIQKKLQRPNTQYLE